MNTRLNDLVKILNSDPIPIFKNGFNKQRFKNSYSITYDVLPEKEKIRINKEIELNSDKRTKKYEELFMGLKEKIVLLTEVINDENLVLHDNIELVNTERNNNNTKKPIANNFNYGKFNSSRNDKYKSVIQSNSIIDYLNNETLDTKNKNRTKNLKANQITKRNLNKNRSVIIEQASKNVNFYLI